MMKASASPRAPTPPAAPSPTWEASLRRAGSPQLRAPSNREDPGKVTMTPSWRRSAPDRPPPLLHPRGQPSRPQSHAETDPVDEDPAIRTLTGFRDSAAGGAKHSQSGAALRQPHSARGRTGARHPPKGRKHHHDP